MSSLLYTRKDDWNLRKVLFMNSSIAPIVLGCQGLCLMPDEASFFRDTNPFGFILFKRNCETPEQIKALTSSLREVVGREDVVLFIDQEGGRVARLRPPVWGRVPSARTLGILFEKDREKGREATRLHAAITASMLRFVGLNGNCVPVLDLAVAGATEAIGDRALSANPAVVVELGRIIVQEHLKQGIYPVVKHMPGHGRASVDPHIDLPIVDVSEVVLSSQDFVPFKALGDAPMGMTCHVVFKALDAAMPASLSSRVHQNFIRTGLSS